MAPTQPGDGISDGVLFAGSPRRAPKNLTQERSTERIVYFGVGVKDWAECPPSVAAVRPVRCPCCGIPGAELGGRVGLHGHGLRKRTLLGPLDPAEAPEVTAFWLRRYACQRCGAIVMSAPREMLRRRRYSGVAIALALALWAEEGLPGYRVKELVSPLPGVGNEAFHGWSSLPRWSLQAHRLWRCLWLTSAPTARALARQVSRQLAARAPMSTGRVFIDAFSGALG